MSETVCPALPGQSAAQVFNADLASCAPGHTSIRDWYEILHENYFRLDVKVGSSFRSGSLERVDIGNIRACMLKCDPMLTERLASPPHRLPLLSPFPLLLIRPIAGQPRAPVQLHTARMPGRVRRARCRGVYR